MDECYLICQNEIEKVYKCPWYYIICLYDFNARRWECAQFDERSALETATCIEGLG